jgi:hypothetical protein
MTDRNDPIRARAFQASAGRTAESLALLAAILLLVAVASASLASAQPPPPGPPRAPAPPRDRGPAGATGTAIIRGRVFAADTGKPLRRARITVTAPELGPEPRTTSTSGEGRYEIKDLPAGRFTIRVARSGYLQLQYGQRRPLEQGRPLQLADRAVADNVDFALPRSASIAGRIIDELSEPVADVQVLPMRLIYWQGRRRLVPAGTGPLSRTDEAGEYRLSGLVPGSYIVMAMLRETWTVTEDGVERTMGYAPTYFPGTATLTDARRVAVDAGKDAGNINFALMPGRAATISGTITDSSGSPLANRSVQLISDMSGPNGRMVMFAGSSPTGGDGSFAIKNVPPGSYRLLAQAIASSSSAQAPIMEVLAMPITLDGSDIDNLSLVTASGGWVRGHLLTETGAPLDVARERFEVRMVAADGNTDPPPPPPPGMPSPAGTMIGENGRIQPDWSFSIGGVRGPSRFTVRVPDGWWVKTIVHDGREVIDSPIEVRGGEEMNDVQVIVSSRVTTVAGQIADDKGAAMHEGTVIVFADDASKWWDDSRWVKTARPDQDGRYQIKGLPPGDYVAVAVSYVEDGMWNDPEYLESIRRYGQKLTLGEGESQTRVLKVVTP